MPVAISRTVTGTISWAVPRPISWTISGAISWTVTGSISRTPLVLAIIYGSSDGTAAEDGHEEALGIVLVFDFLR